MVEMKFKAISHLKTNGDKHTIIYFTLEDLLRGKVVFPHPNHFEFCRYTGLKNKDEQEIYENDIVDTINKVSKIVYSEKFGGFRRYYPRSAQTKEFDYKSAYHFIILGNSIENPEQIKTLFGRH